MYVMNSSGTQFVLSDCVRRVLISQKEDAVTIDAVLTANGETDKAFITLGRYADMDEAREALNELMVRMGDSVFYMPSSRLFFEQTIKHDSRTKRKGKS